MCDEAVPTVEEAYATGVGLLARREHSARELAVKLGSRGFAPELVEQALERLQSERLQSDARYAESYLRQRSGRGYGPQRISAELRERGVDEGLVSEAFREAEQAEEVDWFELAATVYRKKYGQRPIEDMREKAKRMRFMQYRGFTHEQIAAAVDNIEY